MPGILGNSVPGDIGSKKCPKIAATPATPLHFSLVFPKSYLYTVTYAGKSDPEKAIFFAATTRYKPLHFNSCIPSQHILNRFVENIGVIGFPDALRPISDALKSGYDALSDIYDALRPVSDDLIPGDDDLSLKKHSVFQRVHFVLPEP
ncbi:MAG TPA: hypothetical protein VNV88_04075 [Candidatus Solibacter sp.]|jgi:hypothetical protein|nr:hypothetical protein [Candidatus Solibacter sp.]